ncbi:uncharacterized protein LOC141527415 [Cotesia typhae]|uniref:uncharacterized protein LOC141527415 n=1 Tax=Cotesia typhae TaxID=2053667 RepID=UPI003D681273
MIKKLDALEGIKSPGPSIKPVEVLEQISDEDDVEEIKELENPKKKLRFSDSNEGDVQNEEEVEVLETPSDAKRPENNRSSHVPTSKSKFAEGHSSKDDLRKEESSKKKHPKASVSSSCKDSKKQKVMKSSPKMKELGHEGSGVWITRDQWNDAKNKNSFAAMTASLLTSVFPLEVLLKSNYKGGASKNTENKEKKYDALDENILKVIKEAVQERHNDFKDGPFGTAVNNKCGKLRSEVKQQKLKAQKLIENADKQQSTSSST